MLVSGRVDPKNLPPSPLFVKDLPDELPIALEAHRSYQTYQAGYPADQKNGETQG